MVEWDPPTRIVHTWHPGRSPETAQEVELRFRRERDGTRLDLTHRGWETLGDEAQELLGSYDTGWDFVLRRYVERAQTS